MPHYRDDNFYQKGQFHVQFRLEALDEPLDPEAQFRALQALLRAIQTETDLKVSAFVDVYDPDEQDDVDETFAEFVVYNKLGVSSLAKVRRFVEEHLTDDPMPRVILRDPRTNQAFRATDFTIRYLFHDFVAGREPNDWVRLRELVQQPDRGYAELTRDQERVAMPNNRIDDQDELQELGIELEEIAADINELVRRARGILRTATKITGSSMIEERALAYWVPRLEGCIDARGRFDVTMMDTVMELTERLDD
jgi:hypothetical protein